MTSVIPLLCHWKRGPAAPSACESVGQVAADAPTQAPYVLSGDLNGDGIVDTLDLAELQSALDTGLHDTNFDGEVDVFDLLNLISIWGTQYPAP